jgi:hypothetical protein
MAIGEHVSGLRAASSRVLAAVFSLSFILAACSVGAGPRNEHEDRSIGCGAFSVRVPVGWTASVHDGLRQQRSAVDERAKGASPSLGTSSR